MSSDEISLSFEGVSKAEANVMAADLSDFLRERADIDSKVSREDPRTQDFGATIILILSASSVKVIAGAIGTWMQRHREAEARLRISDISLDLSNVDTKTVTLLVEKALEHARR